MRPWPGALLSVSCDHVAAFFCLQRLRDALEGRLAHHDIALEHGKTCVFVETLSVARARTSWGPSAEVHVILAAGHLCFIDTYPGQLGELFDVTAP